MKALLFTTPMQRPLLCAPIRKRTMQDVDLSPKPLPTRTRRKARMARMADMVSPKLFSFFG